MHDKWLKAAVPWASLSTPLLAWVALLGAVAPMQRSPRSRHVSHNLFRDELKDGTFDNVALRKALQAEQSCWNTLRQMHVAQDGRCGMLS